MKVEKNKSYSFKMTSGQEIIGKIKSIEDDSYVLESPLTIGNGRNGLELLPVMFTGIHLADALVYKHSICMIAPIREDVETVYIESVENPSGIAIPAKKQIIL